MATGNHSQTTPCPGDCQNQMLVLDMSVPWVLLCSFLVMTMQLGFAMLEVGSVREAHRMTVLAKNVLDSAVSCMAFWVYVEWTRSRLTFTDDGLVQYHLMTFHCAFCATAVTICSGAMAERTHMGAYLGYAVVMAMLIYPVIADSAWGGPDTLFYKEFHGRLNGNYHYHDFAGSGIVHLTGGCAALVGGVLVGRRILLPKDDALKFASSLDLPMSNELRVLESQALEQERTHRPEGGWPRRFDDTSRDNSEFSSCSYLQVMGMFILWVGWYAFNAGSTLSMDHSASILIGVVAWNTTMSAAGGSFGAYIYCIALKTHLDVAVLTNGTLAGLVAITAGCDVASGGTALFIGVVAGLIVFPLSSRLSQGMKLDDPVDAVSVHASCGLWGVLAVSFCAPDCARFVALGLDREAQLHFCAEDHSFGQQFLAQLWGSLTIFIWTACGSGVLWGVFVLSECTRALEVKYLEEAIGLLFQMIVVQPNSSQVTIRAPSKELALQWQHVVRYSPNTRKILKRHGWQQGHFEGGTPERLWSLRHDLEQARGEKAETALEVADKSILSPLASCLYACTITRELAVIRLRITPAAEISGLGAATADGGQFLQVIKNAVALLSEARRDQRSFHSPLRREVRELSMTVQNQEVLLEALMRSSSRNRARWRRPLGSVPETQEGGADCEQQDAARPVAPEHSSTDLGSLTGVSHVGSDEPPANVEAVTEALGRLFPRSCSQSSDRTLSDRSAGALTPRSMSGDTPPPTIIGRSSRARRQADAQASELATQLVGVLQSHQQLLTALQQHVAVAPTLPVSGSTTPDSRGSPTRSLHQHLQQALQSMQQPGGGGLPSSAPPV